MVPPPPTTTPRNMVTDPGPRTDTEFCPVCYEPHRTRWSTECGHTVCIECWRSMSRTHQRTEVACPICRTLTDITELIVPVSARPSPVYHRQSQYRFLCLCFQAYRYYLHGRYTETPRRDSHSEVTHINPNPSSARIAIQRGEEYLVMFPWQSLFLLVECSQTTRNFAKMVVRRAMKEHLILSTHIGRSLYYVFDRPYEPRRANTMSMPVDDMDVLSYYTMIYSENYIQHCIYNDLCMIFVFPPTG
jgi:hypothetical protein